jgi:hypothetical protein
VEGGWAVEKERRRKAASDGKRLRFLYPAKAAAVRARTLPDGGSRFPDADLPSGLLLFYLSLTSFKLL